MDAGCGAGIIGICAAAALGDVSSIRCQDRDELARLVTLHNAAKNKIPPPALAAFAEPLLAGPEGAGWDLILSNIPAKAGGPVLEDFVRRSAGLLNPGGRAMIVAVSPLADFFRRQIADAGAELVLEERGPGHSVFVYSRNAPQEKFSQAVAVNAGTGFLEKYPFYSRASVDCEIEGIPLHIKAVYGAPGFDRPGGAVSVAAKLARRLTAELLRDGASGKNGGPLLVHEPGQGFFPCYLLEFLRGGVPQQRLVLSGRNILALEAARHNIESRHNAGTAALPLVVPAADLNLGRENLLRAAAGRQYTCIAAFPEMLPQSALPKAGKGQLSALWDALPPLLAEGGIFIVALTSSEAERFDRVKPAGFTRLGSIRRDGFRALAYKFR